MVSEVSRAIRIEEAIEKLLARRTKIEKEIKELGQREATNKAQKEDFDKEDKQFDQELEKISALYNNKFAELRKVNIRIKELKEPSFTGNCPECGRPLDIEKNPMLNLCIGCQAKKNNKKR